jgi:hypothetical protein
MPEKLWNLTAGLVKTKIGLNRSFQADNLFSVHAVFYKLWQFFLLCDTRLTNKLSDIYLNQIYNHLHQS